MKKLIGIATVLAVVASLAACGGSTGGESTAQSSQPAASTPADGAKTYDKPEYTLKFGHQLAQSHPYQMAAEKMAQMIEEQTNGRVHIDVFPSNQLGSERELLEGIQMGTVDMCLATGPLASFDKDFYINDLPNLFTSKEHAYRVLDGEIGQGLLDGLEEVRMKGLTFWETGWLCMFNNKQPIKIPEDLKGMSLRTMENTTYINYFTDLNCNPVPMAYSEFVSSVSNGTINGTLSPIVTIYTDKTYEICPYITRSYQWYCPATLVMNIDLWNSFDAELQKIFIDCANVARDYEREQLAQMEDDYAQKIIEAGGEIIDVDQEIWQNLDSAIQASWKDIVPEKVSQELIDKIKALADETA